MGTSSGFTSEQHKLLTVVKSRPPNGTQISPENLPGGVKDYLILIGHSKSRCDAKRKPWNYLRSLALLHDWDLVCSGDTTSER